MFCGSIKKGCGVVLSQMQNDRLNSNELDRVGRLYPDGKVFSVGVRPEISQHLLKNCLEASKASGATPEPAADAILSLTSSHRRKVREMSL